MTAMELATEFAELYLTHIEEGVDSMLVFPVPDSNLVDPVYIFTPDGRIEAIERTTTEICGMKAFVPPLSDVILAVIDKAVQKLSLSADAKTTCFDYLCWKYGAAMEGIRLLQTPDVRLLFNQEKGWHITFSSSND